MIQVNSKAHYGRMQQKGSHLHDGAGRIYDATTWQPLPLPAGRRYHTALAEFAADGRFLSVGREFPAVGNKGIGFFDTKTEKVLYTSRDATAHTADGDSGFGYLESGYSGSGAGPELVRFTRQRKVPPEILELWAQVVVRGELGPEEEFVRWDEPKWDVKRLELAAIPPPDPNFPFPGAVTTDKLYWLQARKAAEPFSVPSFEDELLDRANDLLRRAEARGDQAEANRWRAECAKCVHPPEVAPPPRAVKQ